MKTNEMKRTPAIEATIDTNGLVLAFANGEMLTLHHEQLSTDIWRQALYHGLKQKLVDAAAISRNPETGRSATIDDKYNAVKTVYDRLLSGDWNATREGGANAGGLLFRALCRLYPAKTPEALAGYLAAKTDKEKTALRANPKVAAMIEEIRAESGKSANIDTNALLYELDHIE